MIVIYAVLIGVLAGAAVYLILRRSIVKLIFGLLLLSQATNLFIFTTGKMKHGNPPIVPAGAETPIPPFVDPLPQALILTAIVISFGVVAFALVLMHRMYETVGADDLNKMRATDR